MVLCRVGPCFLLCLCHRLHSLNDSGLMMMILLLLLQKKYILELLERKNLVVLISARVKRLYGLPYAGFFCSAFEPCCTRVSLHFVIRIQYDNSWLCMKSPPCIPVWESLAGKPWGRNPGQLFPGYQHTWRLHWTLEGGPLNRHRQGRFRGFSLRGW